MQADIPAIRIRIRDQRHTFALLLVSGGASPEMTGHLSDQTRTGATRRYAHPIDPPLRTGVNAVSEMSKPRLQGVETFISETTSRFL